MWITTSMILFPIKTKNHMQTNLHYLKHKHKSVKKHSHIVGLSTDCTH